MADTPSTRRDKNVDGGWAYLILVAAHVFYFIYVGIGKTMGVMLPTLKEQFNTQTWLLGSIISIRSASADFTGIPSVLLARRVPTRWIILASGSIISCGLIFASVTRSVTLFAIFVSVFTGTGFGFSIPLLKTTLGFYFKKRYGFATGLSTAGVSLGTIAMAPFTQLLMDVYGWRGTLLVIGGISLNLIALGALVRPLERHEGDTLQPLTTASSGGSHATQPSNEDGIELDNLQQDKGWEGSPVRRILYHPVDALNSGVRIFAKSSDISLFRKFSFVTIVCIVCIINFQLTAWYIYFVPHALDMGFGKYEASLFVTVYGIGHLVGKLFSGPVVDRGIITSRQMLFITTALTSLLLFLDTLMTTVAAMVIGMLLLGMNIGISNSMFVVVNRDVVGLTRLANSIAWTSLVSGLARLPAGFFPGWIYDTTSRYDNVFFVLGAVTAICPLILVTEGIMYRRYRKSAPA